MVDKEFDYNFKILLLGESTVGKTCLLLRYADNSFTPNFVATLGVDFKIKTITLNNKSIKCQIWDTAGQDRFRTIVTNFYRGAQGILLVFDLTNINSFLKTTHWMGEILKHAPQGIKILLVGNKSDLASKRMVDQKDAMAFAEKNGLKYAETSAKDGTGVAAAFEVLLGECVQASIDSRDKAPAPDPNKVNLGGNDPNSNTNQGGCC